MINHLAGLPLSYVINKNSDDGAEGRITEPGFNAEHPPKIGIGIAYGNLLIEKELGEPARYAPFLKKTGTAANYNEAIPDPKGPGFRNNITDQCVLRQSQGWKFMEWDNADQEQFSLLDIVLAIETSRAHGLGVVAKNPLNLSESSAHAYVAHPNIFGAIVEKGGGEPEAMDTLRRKAGNPDLPIWWVFHGNQRAEAERIAALIKAGKYKNMSVTYSSEGEYGNAIAILDPIGSAPPIQPDEPMPDAVPPWLVAMRAITGTLETPGSADNPKIMAWRDEIGRRFPDMKSYCAEYTHDSVPWCGLAVAYVMAVNGIRPVFGPTDTDKFLWAAAWAKFGRRLATPKPGCIMVLTRAGGGHVTLLEAIEGDYYVCRGGNQSDAVNVARYHKSKFTAAVWPDQVAVTQPDDDGGTARPEIKIGDTGPYVVEAQTLLGITVTGEFDDVTDVAVREFQEAHGGLDVDGEVGEKTWPALIAAKGGKPKPPPVTSGPLTPETITRITSLAAASALARYKWQDRGVAPIGYIKGMAVTYGLVYSKWKAGDSAARVMAAPLGDPDRDALAWYAVTNIARLPIPGSPEALRRLFLLLFGLGMRESSGNCFEGRDTSANNTAPDTTEAGLFQTSWNIHTASPEIPKLFAAYAATPEMFLSIFREGVAAKSTARSGNSDGERFQQLSKTCPPFAVEVAAVGLRVRGGGPIPKGHWGPVSRREVEIRPEADALLRQVEQVVDSVPTVKPDKPPIDGEVLDPLLPAVQRLLRLQHLLRIFYLIMVLKEKTMANPAAGQHDIETILKQIQTELQALSGTKQIAGADPASTRPPAPPPQMLTAMELSAMLQQAIATGNPVAVPVRATTPPASGGTPIETPPPPVGGVLPGLAGGLSISGIIAYLMDSGLIGTAFGMGQAPTTGGTIGAIVGALAPVIGAAGGFSPVINIGLKLLGGLGDLLGKLGKPKTP